MDQRGRPRSIPAAVIDRARAAREAGASLRAAAKAAGCSMNTVRRAELSESQAQEERVKARSYARKRAYGLTDEEYDSLLQKYNRACGICGTTERLCVDHDHETGAVRGILCEACNIALGCFRDDPARLCRAADYLLRHKSRSDLCVTPT